MTTTLAASGQPLQVGDIEIGGVEVKDGATDTRAKVKTDGTDNALVVMQNGGPTAIRQDTGNASLASIDTKLTTLLSQTDGLEASLALLIPAANCVVVTPDDDNDLANNTRGLMVSVAGDVAVDFVTTGTNIVLTDLHPGIVYPFQVKRVRLTGTTATGILGLR